MKRNHTLTDRVAEYLAQQDIHPFNFDGNSFFACVTTGDGVDVSLHVVCTCASPSLVRVAATLPIVVPSRLHGAVASVLNVINRGVPCGGFTIDPADGRISLENSAMIPDEEHPRVQLRWLLFLNANMMRRQALTLIRIAIGGLPVSEAIALVTGEIGDTDTHIAPDPERIRWN